MARNPFTFAAFLSVIKNIIRDIQRTPLTTCVTLAPVSRGSHRLWPAPKAPLGLSRDNGQQNLHDSD